MAAQVEPRFASIATELQLNIFENNGDFTLIDLINALELFFYRGAMYILPIILDEHRDKLLSNEPLCKAIFKYPPYNGTRLKPQLKPTGSMLTYPQLIRAAKQQFQHAEVSRLETEYDAALIVWRRNAMLRTAAYRDGVDQPNHSNCRKFNIAMEGGDATWTYLKHIAHAYAGNGGVRNVQRAHELEDAREAQDGAVLTNSGKVQVLIMVFKRLLREPDFLPQTCRRCGCNVAARFPHQDLPHCLPCYEEFVKETMVSTETLRRYHIQVGPMTSHRGETWIHKMHVRALFSYQGQYLRPGDADTLCLLYHGLSFDDTKRMHVAGNLTAATMAANASHYGFAASVAEAIGRQVNYDAGQIRIASPWSSDQPSIVTTPPSVVSTALLRLIKAELGISGMTQQLWTEIVYSVKQQMIGLLSGAYPPSPQWLTSKVISFWTDRLAVKLGRVLLADKGHLKIARVNKFDRWTGQPSDELNKFTLLTQDISTLCWLVHFTIDVGQVVQIPPAQRRRNLTVYHATAAALLNILRRYHHQLAELIIDLVAIGLNAHTGNNVDIQSRELRFWLFFDLARRFFSATGSYPLTTAFTKLADVPDNLSRALADTFLTAVLFNDGVFAGMWEGLNSVMEGKEVRFLMSPKAEAELSADERRPVFVQAAVGIYMHASSVHTHDEKQALPVSDWAQCGRVAVRKEVADLNFDGFLVDMN